MAKPPVGIVLDTDMSRPDDVLALALLYGLDGKNEARVVAVSVSKPNLKAAALAEVIGRFYAGAVSGAFGAVSRTLPVGLALRTPMDEDTAMLAQTLARPEYQHGIHQLNDTAEPVPLLRNALTAQHDQNAIVLLNGPATTLAKMLVLPGIKQLIQAKVRYLVVSGGNFQTGEPDSHIRADIPAAQKLFQDWPTDIVVSGEELGSQILFPASSIEKDFAWSQAHPVADAYRAYRPMPYDAPTHNMVAALYAVRPAQNYFKTSERGWMVVDNQGRIKFTPSPEGKHRYLILDPAQKENVLRALIELASAKPVPRQPRFPRQQQQQPQQQQQQQQRPQPQPLPDKKAN
ncbi:MAG: nucleoside hydrolase [Bryobacteraceae bacterium]|nr:nucleoside hydrolase [Bryobacteraceae bacterium]MDW8378029.1 nucleoside hydrolase [Bryobacterales bacterium]